MAGKKVKKIITHLICLLLAWTSVVPAYAGTPVVGDSVNEADILAIYPNAKIIHVDPVAYPQLADQLRQQGYEATTVPVQLANNEVISNNVVPVGNYPVLRSDDCDKSDAGSTAGDESVQLMVDISNDMMKSSGKGNRDTAAVVFVIIGTVLIVVWALYVFKYIYDVSIGFRPCGKWSDFAMTSSAISGSDNQHARFYGLRYMTGFRNGATEVGISAELGNADILLDETNAPALKGMYWFIGPVLRWRMSAGNNPSYFQMNFLAGSTEHDEMGVIAQANLGVQFGIGDGWKLGLSWGAMNINLKNYQGIISDRERYYYLYGVNMGYQF